MQRYFAKKIEDKQVTLETSDLHHIKNVMKMVNGEKIEVVYNKEVYICAIEYQEKDILIKIENQVSIKKDNMPEITLIIPLLKEQKIDIILQKSTELGVTRIIPVNLSRSIIKLSKEDFNKKQIRWTRICKEASEQSKRHTVPVVENLKNIEELKLEGLNLICSTNEKTKTIKNIMKSNLECGKINIIAGPEGGITEKEEEKLINMGFIPVTLGSRIMRIETVPIYIMSVVNYEFME